MNLACSLVASSLLLAVVGCSSSSNTDGTGTGTGGAGSSAPAENTPTAAPSTCGAAGQAISDYRASCSDGAAIQTIDAAFKDSAKRNAFCGDKRWGTLFFVNGDKGKELHFCTGPASEEWFVFGDQYANAIAVNTGTDVLGFALGPGHSYRCFSRENFRGNLQVIDNRKPLPIGEPLECGGVVVVDASSPPKVTIGGHTLSMIAIANAPTTSVPPTPSSACAALATCCAKQTDAQKKDLCDSLAAANTSASNETGCQSLLDNEMFGCR